MITINHLAEGYPTNLHLIKMQTEGLTHAYSLIQTPHNINCLNWVLGHIAIGRDRVLSIFGEEPFFSEAEVNRYKIDSDSINADAEDVIRLERMIAILMVGHTKFDQSLSKIDEETLSEWIKLGTRQILLV
ncbi:MAG: hypothetical protein JSV42_17510 [Chloroflexota bacterium]|nr:MAG: hypothetical protein JSV42_17510 [Chloroflexota bacterium]